MTEITPEQRAAVEWLQQFIAPGRGSDIGAIARTLLDALPANLTDPQPELPTKPGWYLDADGSAWELDAEGGLSRDGFDLGYQVALDCAPFTRLVPERAAVTREHVVPLLNGNRRWISVIEQADAILALVNGTDRD